MKLRFRFVLLVEDGSDWAPSVGAVECLSLSFFTLHYGVSVFAACDWDLCVAGGKRFLYMSVYSAKKEVFCVIKL